MFVFLGLPAILLAAILTAYAGGVLARAQRREQASLRLRGAHRGHLVRALAFRTLAIAGVGSLIGGGLGFLSALAILGSEDVLRAAPADLAASAIAAVGGGMLVTGLALFLPARRSLSREIGQERRELALAPPPAWHRLKLDVLLLAAAALAELIAWQTGALDLAAGSMFEGRSVSLPTHLLLAPLAAWAGGVLLVTRLLVALATRLPAPSPPHFRGLVSGLLARSLRRRPWDVVAGIVALGLVVAFGTSLRSFIATYDAAKAADARFIVGSDLRITPGAASTRRYAPRDASQLRVDGVSGVSPVVFRLENSVLIGPYKRARTDLAAIDPITFGRVAALSDSFFAGRSASAALAALHTDPHGVLVDKESADDLSLAPGDRVRLILALGTRNETVATFRVAGLFTRFPGFARRPNLIVGLGAYTKATNATGVDFFLASTNDHDRNGLERAIAAIRSSPGGRDSLTIASTETTLDKDQSSLTALNVRGLVGLGSLFTLLMSAAVIAIFVSGLILQRRREYVVLRAQGMDSRRLLALVLGDVALIALGGLAAGLVAGAGTAFLLVEVLRPLFLLSPEPAFPPVALAVLVAATATTALGAAVAATAALRHVRPTEILRGGLARRRCLQRVW